MCEIQSFLVINSLNFLCRTLESTWGTSTDLNHIIGRKQQTENETQEALLSTFTSTRAENMASVEEEDNINHTMRAAKLSDYLNSPYTEMVDRTSIVCLLAHS